ncbi:MAG: STAS domain-containing protein [Bacillus sp. (in: firmicutes)]|jgi:rsbT co-antagonist protein RsbR
MHRSETLHSFLLSKARQLTEDWYNSLDKSDPKGVYSSNDPKVIENVKRQNYEFHLHLCEIFILEECEFFTKFQSWIEEIARDTEHQRTPIHFVIREFMRTREQYLDFLDEFVELHKDEVTPKEVKTWNRLIVKTFDTVILRFAEETHNASTSQLIAQQEMINELSSPVITLSKDSALLPLVGDIDTARAKLILENTLEQCASKNVNQLFIDLSGVIMIDTMVAHQIFLLIDALNLIGVETTLSGLRPEIAQTAVQLGLNFNKVSIKSNLSKALSLS